MEIMAGQKQWENIKNIILCSEELIMTDFKFLGELQYQFKSAKQ